MFGNHLACSYIYFVMIDRNDRRSKEEGHMAALIRRKMIQKDHGDKTKYSRKQTKSKLWHKEGDQN